MVIRTFYSETIVSIENETIQQNEEEQIFEENQNIENVERNLFDEFDEVASETE